jgi:DNA-directed RNA polymerase subunit F
MDKNEAASSVELKYWERIDAMTPKERVARTASLFQWTRETIARQIIAESGPMSSEQLKWLVAMRQYGADKTTREMIQKVLDNVSA